MELILFDLWARECYTRLSLAYNKPCNRAQCYAEIAVSSPEVTETIARTQCADPRRDGQAEWPGKYWDGIAAKGRHQSQY